MVWVYRALGIMVGFIVGALWSHLFYMSVHRLEWPKSNCDKVNVRATGMHMGGLIAAFAVNIINQTAQGSMYKPPYFGLNLPIKVTLGIICAVASALLGLATFLVAYYSVNKGSYWDEKDKKQYKAKSNIIMGMLLYFGAFAFVLIL